MNPSTATSQNHPGDQRLPQQKPTVRKLSEPYKNSSKQMSPTANRLPAVPELRYHLGEPNVVIKKFSPRRNGEQCKESADSQNRYNVVRRLCPIHDLQPRHSDPKALTKKRSARKLRMPHKDSMISVSVRLNTGSDEHHRHGGDLRNLQQKPRPDSARRLRDPCKESFEPVNMCSVGKHLCPVHDVHNCQSYPRLLSKKRADRKPFMLCKESFEPYKVVRTASRIQTVPVFYHQISSPRNSPAKKPPSRRHQEPYQESVDNFKGRSAFNRPSQSPDPQRGRYEPPRATLWKPVAKRLAEANQSSNETLKHCSNGGHLHTITHRRGCPVLSPTNRRLQTSSKEVLYKKSPRARLGFHRPSQAVHCR